MAQKTISIVWVTHDLRITDNPALHAAAQQGTILPIYIHNPDSQIKLGQSSRWWLHYSLQELNSSLDEKLNLYIGKPTDILIKIAETYSIKAIYVNKVHEPAAQAEHESIQKAMKAHNIEYHTLLANLLWEPADIVKDDGTPYKVFTPFYRNGCLGANPPRIPLNKPDNMMLIKDTHNSITLDDLTCITDHELDQRLQKIWNPSEQTAHNALQHFITHGLAGYQENRDFPDRQGVSRLSPFLHFGQISPNQVWYAVSKAHAPLQDIDCFLKQLGWREFSYNLLYNFPKLPDKNYQPKFDAFTWAENSTKLLHAWQQGKTGYPIVDAGMRELAQTGLMHNRVRMIVASFLIKNLLIDWRHGRDWFWEHLVDADLANNSASWQWVAGSGADAAPFFRIFNPILQGEKFDAQGDYTRHYVPELTTLPDKYLYQPWLAPADILRKANIKLGKDYPLPIVDLATSRNQALNQYKKL